MSVRTIYTRTVRRQLCSCMTGSLRPAYVTSYLRSISNATVSLHPAPFTLRPQLCPILRQPSFSFYLFFFFFLPASTYLAPFSHDSSADGFRDLSIPSLTLFSRAKRSIPRESNYTVCLSIDSPTR